MIRVIFIIFLIILFVYINNKTEHFSNISGSPNYPYSNNFDNLVILDDLNNLNNLNSTNKTVNYNLGEKPMYNIKDYNALSWHLRFKNLIKNRYAYDDTTPINKCKSNDGKNFQIINEKNKKYCDLINENKFNANEGTNCHGNNCDESNCYGNNCYETGYARLKDLPNSSSLN
jgi:hypothetical protein